MILIVVFNSVCEIVSVGEADLSQPEKIKSLILTICNFIVIHRYMVLSAEKYFVFVSQPEEKWNV